MPFVLQSFTSLSQGCIMEVDRTRGGLWPLHSRLYKLLDVRLGDLVWQFLFFAPDQNMVLLIPVSSLNSLHQRVHFIGLQSAVPVAPSQRFSDSTRQSSQFLLLF